MRRCIIYLLLLLSSEKSQSFFFDDLLNASSPGNSGLNASIPETGAELENLIFRSCYVCHGTSISSVTSSCWETVDEEHTRFVSVRSCYGACSITVLNHTTIGLIDYTRRCEPDCAADCYLTDQSTHLCKYCCYGDRCNDVLPTYVQEGPDAIEGGSEINLRNWLKGPMSKPRHHAVDPSNKIAARSRIIKMWRDFGLNAEMQEFRVTQTILEDKAPSNYRSYLKTVIKGYNLIATIRGRNYGTLSDNVIVVMAHYDTHPDGTPGVDDNASGVVSLLEITRLLMRNVTCARDNSILLVATDFKELGSFWDGLAGTSYTNCVTGDRYAGLTGSSHFLCGYLLPHLRRTGSRLMMAMNLHSLLNYDARKPSQGRCCSSGSCVA